MNRVTMPNSSAAEAGEAGERARSPQGVSTKMPAAARPVHETPRWPGARTLDRSGDRGQSHYALGYRPLSVELLRVLDTVVAASMLAVIFIAVNASSLPNGLPDFLLLPVSVKNLLLLCGGIAIWQLLFSAAGLYDTGVISRQSDEVPRVVGAVGFGSLAVLLASLVEATPAFPPSIAPLFFGGVVAGTVGVRTLLRELNARTRTWTVRDVVIVGSGPRAYKLYKDLQKPNSGYNLLGFVDSNDHVELEEIEERLIGRLDELETLLMRHPIDEVLIALPIRSCYSQIEAVIRTCEAVGVESRYFADVFEKGMARPSYSPAGDVPAVSLKVVQDDARVILKRAIDWVAAAVALIVLAPLMLAIAAGIKLTSPGPVIFSQRRYGRNRRLFNMYKFRTMVSNAEALQVRLEHLNEVPGPVFKISFDPRVTNFGRFLRRTSLDELPQLFNILRGEMSFIGPRPLPIRDVSRFHEGRLMRRFSVVPGLSCLWQISGRSHIDFDEWLRLDLEYIDNWSLTLDLIILLRTIPAVLRGTGAS